MLQRELLYAALGTGFTCGATILGAAMVFFFKKDIHSDRYKYYHIDNCNFSYISINKNLDVFI